jgi:single-strand DNA-binding protein
MLNKVMLIGYVGADSEMKFTPGGIPVTNFSLAVNETYSVPSARVRDLS